MKSLPQRALIATTLATALVGTFATAIVQASALQPAEATAPTLTVVAQANTTAQPATPVAPRPERLSAEQREQKRAEHRAHAQQKMAERQAALKDELKLTPAQEPAWNAFIARTQPQAGVGPARERGSREDWTKLTTPQRLDKMQALKAERDAAMAKRVDAIKAFYAQLNPEQQKVFDSKRIGGFQRASMHRGHGHQGQKGPRHGEHGHKAGPV
ncbi:Spy/CpxP family protein refolding chaperone [Hydrogenophaga palleronii]|uniref:Spy/CpxP family protein refolding chaperone n=1 Tax=Hydrogenophaga palleronii TaxID=65655 RepID=UPI0008246DBB|nr:Spy/CpxP family protein refolding chaperone [Hydrogenophaga palleronii]